MRAAIPERLTAATLSPPPITLRAPPSVASATAWQTALVPPAKDGSSKTPMGPFQKIVPAPASAAAMRAHEVSPMSTALELGGNAVAATDLYGGSNIVVEGNRITQAGDAPVETGPDDRVIDATGKLTRKLIVRQAEQA